MKAICVRLAALAAMVALQPVHAHTELAESVPTDGATVTAAPDKVELRFSAPVRLTALAVQQDGSQKQSLGPLPGETSASFAVDLPALDEGHYVVTWRALSEDTHVVSGEFMFAVGAAQHPDAHSAGDAQAQGEPVTESAPAAHGAH